MNFVTYLNNISKNPITRFLSEILWLEKIIMLNIDDLSRWKPPILKQLSLPITYHVGTEGDVEIINITSDFQTSHDSIHNLELIKNGHLLFIAKLNDEIIYTTWVMTRRKSFYDHFYIMNAEEFILTKSFTRKKYRGHGIHSHGLVYILNHMANLCYKRVFIDIASQNIFSLNVVQKLGFTVLHYGIFRLRAFCRDYLILTNSDKARFLKKNNRFERV